MSRNRIRVLEAERLAFEITEEPWGCRFFDTRGGHPIEEASLVAGSPAGSFGFQTERSDRTVWRHGPLRDLPGPSNEKSPANKAWHHAIGLEHFRTTPTVFSAELRTDDPGGRLISIEVAAASDSTISVAMSVIGDTRDLVAVGHAFRLADDEAFFGFGERSDEVSRTQGVVEQYVGEGPWQEYEYPFLEGVVPAWGVRQRRDSTYFPIPWALSTKGYGILIDNDELSYFRLRSETPDTWSFEVEANELRYRVFAGPSPLDALRRFTESTGRQPEPGARWWFGPWYQTGHTNHVPLEDEKQQLQKLRDARAPVSAAETHCRFLPGGAHRGWEESERERAKWFREQGLASLSYLNPMISEEYEEVFSAARSSGALQSRSDGSPCVFAGYIGDKQPPITNEAHFEFASDSGLAAWESVALQLVESGHSGWMEDFGEYSPLDAVSGTGLDGTAAHNSYPRDYHGAASEVADRLASVAGEPLCRFVRSGWTGTARSIPAVWGGDPTCSWGFDGLSSAVIEGLSMGASGIAMWGSDTGGFVSSVDHLTPELLRRWIQFSSCCPIMRTKSAGIELPPYDRPQIWDPDVIETWVRWAAWHTQLNDYLAAAHAEYRSTGVPIMRALGLLWPEFEVAVKCVDQYLLGHDLLIAPVIEPEVTERTVWVPPGAWIDLWRVARYEPSTRSLELTGSNGAGTGILHGPTIVTLQAPADEIPILVRAGAALTLLSNDVDTLVDRRGRDGEASNQSSSFVRASERDHERVMLAWPLSRETTFDLETLADRQRNFRVSLDLRIVGDFTPSRLAIDGTEVQRSSWSFSQEKRILFANFEATRGTLNID